jgi:aarF domain-containing kinase
MDPAGHVPHALRLHQYQMVLPRIPYGMVVGRNAVFVRTLTSHSPADLSRPQSNSPRLPNELDFEIEAHNIRRVRTYFSQLRETLPLIVPSVLWAKRRIIVMEYLPGARLDDLDFLDRNKISRDEVSASLARIFNEMIFGKDAPLHCDPHGGNLAVRKNTTRGGSWNFDIVLYDHGLYRDIPLETRRSYAKLWLAVLDADMERMKRYAGEVAGITEEQFPLFASAITGRDWSVVQKGISAPRTAEEKQDIGSCTSPTSLFLRRFLANSV